MATMPTNFIKQLKLSDKTYEIIAGYINDGQGGAKDWNDIKSLIAGSFQLIISTDAASTPSGVTWKDASGNTITGTLAASAAEYPAIYFVPVDLAKSTQYNEYIAVGATQAARKWEKIGMTDIDLSQYSKKTHTHTVTPSSLTISAAASGAEVQIDTTANAITGFGTHTTAKAVTGFGTHTKDNVLGADTTFTTTVTPTTTNVKATATGTAISTNDDTFVKSYPGETSKLVKASVVPAVANGTVIPAVAVASGSRPTKTVFGTDTTASKVTVGTSTGAASKATAGTATVYGTADVGTAVSIPNVTSNASVTIPNVTANVASDASAIVASGTTGATAIATFTPSVSAAGVLEFSFTSKAYKASDATKTTLGTALTATNTGLGTAISVTPAVAAPTTQKFTPYTFADVDIPTVSATDVTVPVVASNNEVEVAKAGTAVDVAKAGTAVSFATGALDAEGTGATIMTGLGTAVTADALTSAAVSAQPTITLATGASAGTGVVSVATGITSATTTAGSGDVVSAMTALGTPTTADAITALGTPTTAAAATAISVKTQPTIKINNKASETVAAATQVTTSAASE